MIFFCCARFLGKILRKNEIKEAKRDEEEGGKLMTLIRNDFVIKYHFKSLFISLRA